MAIKWECSKKINGLVFLTLKKKRDKKQFQPITCTTFVIDFITSAAYYTNKVELILCRVNFRK